MRKRGKILVLSFLLMLSVLAWSTGEVWAQRWCDLCAMDLQKYRLTKYILTPADGDKRYSCSIHCVAIILGKQKVGDVKVANYLTSEMIDARKAYYLVGSDIKGVMSKVSKLAFVSKANALEFQGDHGGELTDFEGALKAANLDMAEDRKMLREKVKMMIQLGRVVAEVNSCFVCHGIDGKGSVRNPGSKTGYVTAWNTEKFARNMNSKAKLKKVILAGVTECDRTEPEKIADQKTARLKMPAWKSFIEGKELHALINYIWSLRPKR